MSHLGRLPPLHAIGRSQCVDLEDPPDLPEDDIDQFLDEYDNKEKVYRYGSDHPAAATNALGQYFHVLTPGGHACRQIAETATAFTHSRHSVAFSSKYAELRHLLQTEACLQLIKDYVSRLNAASMFVKDVEVLVLDEYKMWYSVCHNTRSVPPVTKLECLSAICEDLRIHTNHWNSVKQLLYTNPWLRLQLPTLILQMQHIQLRLHQLCSTAIWWIDRLIHIGFRVLAHCDLEHIEADALWCITRGLEDFNHIVSEVKHNMISNCKTCYDFEQFNSYKNIGDMIKPVPFATVLNILASERARYASASTHLFFTSCTGLLRIALGMRGVSASYNWSEDGAPSLGGSHLTDTSDYHTASGSHISLGTAMLQVGAVTAPDLSEEPSPLMDFARREKTFAQKFLQIVCHSTSLLPRQLPAGANHMSTVSSHKRSPLLGQTMVVAKKTDSDTRHGTEKSQNKADTASDLVDRSQKLCDHLAPDSSKSSLQSGGTTRKSVSWSDVGEVSIIQQLLHRYMDMLWRYFGSSLADQFMQPIWGGPDGVRGQLGSTLLCSDVILEVIAHMMQHTCAKDIFPSRAASVLTTVAERIQVTHAWRAWDLAMCNGLASAVTDKCHPILLADGEYSSNTARCLRDAFHPLHSALHCVQTSLNVHTAESCKNVSLALAVPTVHRLVMSCDVSIRWCSTRGLLYLESWTLGAFLLVTQSDFKILGDEVRRGAANCQMLTSDEAPNKDLVTDSGHVANQNCDYLTATENYNIVQLNKLQRKVEELAAQLQTLSGNLVKQFSEKCHYQSVEYFEEEMPVGKFWKKRQTSDGPLEGSQYVEHALDLLLEPIIAGSSKLSTTSQLSVISMATTAMCEAWTDVILEQKIKFSMNGALQLEADFHLVRTWLETYIQSASVKQSILSLDIFKYLTAIIDILKRQPRGRASSRPPESRNRHEDKSTASMCKRKTLIGLQINVGEGKATRQRQYEATSSSCDISTGTGSSNQWVDTTSVTGTGSIGMERQANNHVGQPTSVTSPGSDTDINYKMPNMEQWLALRVQGGARSWPKLPSCFNNLHS